MASPMQAPGEVSSLARVLDVRPGDDGAATRFRGAPFTTASARMFGGHAMAQALLAAGRTVSDPLTSASLHCVLLRPGDASVPCDLEVDVVRDGRSFATRRVQVAQGGRTLALVTTSWHAAEECSLELDDDRVGLPARPDPQSLPYPAPGVATDAFDLRWADDGLDRVLWFRSRDDLPEGRDVGSALSAYVSDLWLADTALRRLGRRFDDRAVRASTLEHSVWWHRPVDLAEWSRLRSSTVAAQHGRGLVLADLRSEDGTALASVTQAVSLRDRPAPAAPSDPTSPAPSRSTP